MALMWKSGAAIERSLDFPKRGRTSAVDNMRVIRILQTQGETILAEPLTTHEAET
jgi:hypothetical protein